MPVTRRKLVDNFVGTLKNGVTALGTQLVSDQFPALPTDFSTTNAMPLVIADDSQGIFEVVLVTGHSSGTNSVTVIRGAQGTAGRSWDPGAVLRVATTSRDLMQSMSASAGAALNDSHVGMEFTDENLIGRKQTARQGFHPLAHFMAGGISGLASPSNLSQMELLSQAFVVSAVTSAQGFINGSLPAGAFPNGILGVIASPKNAPDGTGPLYLPQFCQSYTTTAATTADSRGPVLQFSCRRYDNAAYGNIAVIFSVLVLGV